MIKVLERKVTCPNCKAKLQYEQEDIQIEEEDFKFWESQAIKYIICPDCGNKIILTPTKR